MATNTTQLTRRSFSTLLAAGGFASITSRHAAAQDSIESEQNLYLPFDETWSSSDQVVDDSKSQERWKSAENEVWQWYERESFVQGQWKPTGITTPVHRVTRELVEGVPGYLDESLVPIQYRRVDNEREDKYPATVHSERPPGPESYGRVSLQRRAHDGRPPSEWLRSMDTEELREWLAKVEVSEAGVHGMTFWTHLTRDHLFRPLLIKGLTEAEQAKLHAAAHFGY